MGLQKKNGKSAVEKIALFRSCFSGLIEVYGTYDPANGRSWQVKQPVTDHTILAHLTGKKPYGIYLLTGDLIRAIVVDFDQVDASPPLTFLSEAEHYALPAYMEISKSKGYHVWIFFPEQGVKAFKARLVVKFILDEIGQADTEIFPKQDCLDTQTSYGNFINAPLFGALVRKGKTVFIDPASLDVYPDQWAFLESIQRVEESRLDEIMEINDLSLPPDNGLAPSNPSTSNGSREFSLPPCARRILQDGVSRYQRVSCFRLAVNLKRSGLPFDLTVAVLRTWALKNKPDNGKGVIQDSEIIAQTQWAYKGSYTGYGCGSLAVKPFCDVSCPVRVWREKQNKA